MRPSPPDDTSGDDWTLCERHFSPERLAHYLAASHGDQQQAIALYRWNAEISAAFLVPLGYLEVALRNTLDRQMTARHQRLGGSRHWLFDDTRQLGRDAHGPGRHAQPYNDIDTAIRHVHTNRKPLNAEQILSELPFGFWHQLVSRRHTFLWPDLAGGFPYAPSRSPHPIRDRLTRLRVLRNRIGHHHRVWATDLPARYTELLDLAGWIDPDLAGWIGAHSNVTATITTRP
jgi:hypothetical protein